MGSATLYRILRLLALLGMGLLASGGATASDRLQDPNLLSEINGSETSWYIAAQTRGQKKPACVHALEHSHELCRACGKVFVLRSTHRLRARSLVTRSKPNNNFLAVIHFYPAAGAENATARLINGSFSQASRTSANLFASTGRLRI